MNVFATLILSPGKAKTKLNVTNNFEIVIAKSFPCPIYFLYITTSSGVTGFVK